MSFAYPLTGLVTILTLIVYFYMIVLVGKARTKHKVSAPSMTGPDEFMRVIRVHENTIEGLILFLPSLWLFALTTHDMWAAVIGVFYPIGRVIYARAYYQDADKRGRGFLIGLASNAVLLVGAVVAIIYSIITFGV